VNNIPDFAKKYSFDADPLKAPNEIGTTIAKKITKAQRVEILKNALFTILPQDFEGFFSNDKAVDTNLFEFVNVLRNLEYERTQVNPRNFIQTIELMKPFFNEPLDAIHFFYAIVGYWTTSSKVTKVG
ncbi:MAG: hypothetical protein NTU73_12235, partial [Ignavibacteriae bacterium]|nr:hypothetical protein [Ignavibacteriota bacterium]